MKKELEEEKQYNLEILPKQENSDIWKESNLSVSDTNIDQDKISSKAMLTEGFTASDKVQFIMMQMGPGVKQMCKWV